MDVTRLSAAQIAAFAITKQVEPLVRGFVLVSTGQPAVMAMYGVDPDAEIPEDLDAARFTPLLGEGVVLAAINDRSLLDAAEDARGATERLRGHDIVAPVLVSGDYLMTVPEGRVHSLGKIIESLPAILERPNGLQVWAATRAPAFEPVAPATAPGAVDELVEQWLHAIVTGHPLSEELVARLAAAAGDDTVRDRLMLVAIRLGFAELDEASGTEETMSALFGSLGRPQGERLIVAGLAAQFAAAHTTDGPAAAQLCAMAAMLLWGEGRSRAAMRSVEIAQLHDRSNSLAHSAQLLLHVRAYPEWFTD